QDGVRRSVRDGGHGERGHVGGPDDVGPEHLVVRRVAGTHPTADLGARPAVAQGEVRRALVDLDRLAPHVAGGRRPGNDRVPRVGGGGGDGGGRVVQVVLLDERKEGDVHAAVVHAGGRVGRVGKPGIIQCRQLQVGVVVVVHPKPDLLEVVGA